VLNADTNEAFSLLLRYPSLPETQKPTSLVHDALKLHDSLTQETGQTIVLKRTGRKIAKGSVATPLRVSKNRPAQSHLSVPSPASLETILHDAARGVMSRSERWGLNQALRDVLGEVRRNVKTVQASGGNTPPGQSTSVESPRSTKSRALSHSTIAANALRRINALEARNKSLGQMLERATLAIAEVVKELEEHQPTKDQAARLRSAATEVETVYVFLKDIALPLPDDNPAPLASPTKSSLADGLLKTDGGDKPKDTATSPPLPDAPGRQKSPSGSKSHKVDERDSSTSPRPGSSAAIKRPTSTPASPLAKPRPHISESPLSWMLSGNEDRSEIGKPSFLKPASLTQRHSRNQSTASETRSGKGYLFGDMNDSDTSDQQTHDARKRSEARKGTMEEISLEDVRGAEADRGRTE
jgi:TBC1 domain family member 5